MENSFVYHNFVQKVSILGIFQPFQVTFLLSIAYVIHCVSPFFFIFIKLLLIYSGRKNKKSEKNFFIPFVIPDFTSKTRHSRIFLFQAIRL